MKDVLKAQKRRPAMKKISTVEVFGNEILTGQKLTIGLDLGDRWSFYCVLDEAGKILLEQKVATTPEAMKQIFEKIPRSLIAMETGTHSPWISRLLGELGPAAHSYEWSSVNSGHLPLSKRDGGRLQL